MHPLRILMVAAEFAPVAKAGGLADAVAGLAGYLASRGHDVRVLLPDYRTARADNYAYATSPAEASVLSGYKYEWRALETDAGPSIWLLDCPALFGNGSIYASGDDEARRFAFLSAAAVKYCEEQHWSPDIVHCHDWHAALMIPLVHQARETRSELSGAFTVLSIHNIGYQGVYSPAVLDELELDLPVVSGDLNFLKLGIRSADVLATVSPTHAREIVTPEYGMGLAGELREREHRLVGILNGIDAGEWAPETDASIPARFSASDLSGKSVCRRALVAELGLEAEDNVPVVGLVSRFVAQKGIDLVRDALPGLMAQHRFVCAFLGDGDPDLAGAIESIAASDPRRVAFRRGYDEGLAHRIIAGSDLLMVPSHYEPCGLTQLYAMRYGTIPIVRKTGGLADSVSHFDPWTGEGTGAVFEHADGPGLAWATSSALEWWGNQDARQRVVANAMSTDFSWQRQGREYESLYLRLAG